MAHYLYRHFDADGRLLYVGQTICVGCRTADHQRDAHWFTSISRIEIEEIPAKWMVLAAERNAIKSERPLHNVIHAAHRSCRHGPTAIFLNDGQPPSKEWVADIPLYGRAVFGPKQRDTALAMARQHATENPGWKYTTWPLNGGGIRFWRKS